MYKIYVVIIALVLSACKDVKVYTGESLGLFKATVISIAVSMVVWAALYFAIFG